MTDKATIEQTARWQAVAEACRDTQDAARDYVRFLHIVPDVSRDVSRPPIVPSSQDEAKACLAFVLSLQRLDRVLGPAERRGDGLDKKDPAGMRRVVERLGVLRASPASVNRGDVRDFGTAANVWERLVANETASWSPEEWGKVLTLARAYLDDERIGTVSDAVLEYATSKSTIDRMIKAGDVQVVRRRGKGERAARLIRYADLDRAGVRRRSQPLASK